MGLGHRLKIEARLSKTLLEPRRGNRTIRLLAALGPGPMRRFHEEIAAKVNPWRRKGITLSECCQRLEKKKIRTFRGRKWSPSRLVTVLGEVSSFKK